MAPEPRTAELPLTVSVVVPTRDRLERLVHAVRCLLAQTAPIDELIVVDQSATDAGRGRVRALVDAQPAGRRPALHYVWDRAIDGAAAARNAGLDRATGDVVVCVDDDMVPAPDALARLLAHHRRYPHLAAVSPVITNYTPPPLRHRLWTAVFCRGPFRDDRQPVYWHWHRHAGRLVPVGMLGAGMLALRRAALGGVRFDRRYRGSSLGEDIDLSWALAAQGGALAIATDAHVVHDRGPRRGPRHEEALLTSWGFVVDKHRGRDARTRAAFAWFVTGVVLEAAVASARARSAAPLASAARGLAAILHGYRNVPFLAAEGR